MEGFARHRPAPANCPFLLSTRRALIPLNFIVRGRSVACALGRAATTCVLLDTIVHAVHLYILQTWGGTDPALSIAHFSRAHVER